MSDDKEYVLAIDNGTQSVRALVFDLAGQLVAKSKVEIDPYYSDQPGGLNKMQIIFGTTYVRPAVRSGRNLIFQKVLLSQSPLRRSGQPLLISTLTENPCAQPLSGSTSGWRKTYHPWAYGASSSTWPEKGTLSHFFAVRPRLTGSKTSSPRSGIRPQNIYCCQAT